MSRSRSDRLGGGSGAAAAPAPAVGSGSCSCSSGLMVCSASSADAVSRWSVTLSITEGNVCRIRGVSISSSLALTVLKGLNFDASLQFILSSLILFALI